MKNIWGSVEGYMLGLLNVPGHKETKLSLWDKKGPEISIEPVV